MNYLEKVLAGLAGIAVLTAVVDIAANMTAIAAPAPEPVAPLPLPIDQPPSGSGISNLEVYVEVVA